MRWFPAGWSPADETTYTSQGTRVSRHGLTGLRQLAALHVRDPGRHETPSPLRWGWLLLLGGAMRVLARETRSVAIVSTLGHLGGAALAFAVWGPAAGLLVASSPLGVTLGRRALGDTWAALAALALLAAASSGAPWWAVALLAAGALAVKESNAVAVAAVSALGAWRPCLAGVAAWWVLTVTLFGAGTVVQLGRIARRQGDTAYSRAEQRGMPHRVLVDLALVSPAVLVVAILRGSEHRHPAITFAAVSLALSALLHLKNARLLLAAELALRVAVALAVPTWALVALVAVDVAIAWRLRGVYDPVSSELVRVLMRP